MFDCVHAPPITHRIAYNCKPILKHSKCVLHILSCCFLMFSKQFSFMTLWPWKLGWSSQVLSNLDKYHSLESTSRYMWIPFTPKLYCRNFLLRNTLKHRRFVEYSIFLFVNFYNLPHVFNYPDLKIGFQ